MMNKRELLISAVCHAYASMVVDKTEDKYRNTIWYKQACSIDNFFKKKKPVRLKTEYRLMLEKMFEEIKALDADYFTDKSFSPYICMLYCLNYLIEELRSTTIRVKFGHIDTLSIINEIETTDGLKGTGRDTFRYFTKVLDIVERI